MKIHSLVPSLSLTCVLGLAWLTGVPGKASAAVISDYQVTFSTTASGVLGNTFFSGPISFTGYYDQSAIGFNDGIYQVNLAGCTVAIDGLGVYDLTTPLAVFNNIDPKFFGTGLTRGDNSGDLVNFHDSTSFTSWDLASPIASYTGTFDILQWSFGPVVTTGGGLSLSDGNPSGTFTFVPEPTALALACSAGLLVLRRRR